MFDVFLSCVLQVFPDSFFSLTQLFLLRMVMSDKRDAAMAGLSWPIRTRSAAAPRGTGSTDSEMASDDIGHESFPVTAVAAPPPVYSHTSPGTHPWFPHTPYHHHQDYSHYGPWTSSTNTSYQLPSPNFPRERTVHTIYFKTWDPDTPERFLYIEEINQNGFLRRFDPGYFFHKLTGDHNTKLTRCRTSGAPTTVFPYNMAAHHFSPPGHPLRQPLLLLLSPPPPTNWPVYYLVPKLPRI